MIETGSSYKPKCKSNVFCFVFSSSFKSLSPTLSPSCKNWNVEYQGMAQFRLLTIYDDLSLLIYQFPHNKVILEKEVITEM